LRQGEENRLVKVRDRVAAGDRFRVYAIPETEPGHIYVVYADRETAGLLNSAEQIETPKDSVLVLPSLDELYEVDNSSPRFTVTVICSAEKLPSRSYLSPCRAQRSNAGSVIKHRLCQHR
ncbi:MAG: hypothetical protein GY801_20965, partial [bacterium]|nr:hypothetical protein [bacterium]